MERKDSTKSGSSTGSGGPSAGTKKSKGQKSSSERGAATNHKKNPGKRPHQGGS